MKPAEVLTNTYNSLKKLLKVEVFQSDASKLKATVDKTIGPAVNDMQNIESGNALTIRPSGNTTWVIETLAYDGPTTIQIENGTYSIVIDSPNASGIIENANYRITNSLYLTMNNFSGSSRIYSYSGYIVNET